MSLSLSICLVFINVSVIMQRPRTYFKLLPTCPMLMLSLSGAPVGPLFPFGQSHLIVYILLGLNLSSSPLVLYPFLAWVAF